MTSQKFKQTEIGKIPEDWEIKKFLELLKEGTKNGIYKTKEFHGSGVKVVNMKELFSYDRIGDQDMKQIELSDKEKEIFLLKEGDLLFARRSLVAEGAGKCSIVTRHMQDLTFESSIIRARPDNKIVDSEYLFYLFSSSFGRNVMRSILRQVAVSGITGSDLREIPVPVPSLFEQQGIAKILSNIDSKIELNKRINNILEKVGKALFKKWFVDNRKEEWKEGFLGDKILTDLIKPGIDKFEDEKIYIPTANISNSSITSYNYKITFEERPSRASMQPQANTIWFAKMKDSPKIQLFLEGEDWRLNNLILSTGFAGIKPKQEALFYIWNIINSPYFEIEKDNLAMGTTMQAINNQNIERIRYSIPDKQTLIKFNELVSPLYYTISNNNQQNQKLSKIRNLLLPKLMGGEIRVK